MGDQFTDREYLRKRQYKDASNLERRVGLHQRFSTNPQGWLAWVFQQLELPPQARILEVGGGPGLLWAHNRSCLNPSWSLVLSDLSDGMAADARERIGPLSNVSYSAIDAQEIPFPPERFDAVLANHMLYHAPQVERAIAELHRVLKPGGRLYAATNGEHHLLEMAQLVERAWRPTADQVQAEFARSITNFSLQSGGEKLARSFASVQIRRYRDSLHVTDPQAILDFVTSSSVFRLPTGGEPRLRKLLEQEIVAAGAVNIRKDSGMFIATRSSVL